jgi:acyl-CoA thioesterase I
MRLTRDVLCLLLLALTVACGRDETPRTPPTTTAPPPELAAGGDARPAVVFLGTSLTAGLGVPLDAAYPARIQERIDASGLGFRVVNAGVSGDTSAGGLRRIEWLLRQPIAVLVLELGANDMLRGQDVAAMRANLQQIIDRARTRYPDVDIVIAGMQSAPNLGDAYAQEFAGAFADLASANGAALIPFLLDGVASVAELNQADGIHPTAEGQERVADNVWRVLEPVLRARAAAAAVGE